MIVVPFPTFSLLDLKVDRLWKVGMVQVGVGAVEKDGSVPSEIEWMDRDMEEE
jgi:hypothetical protein